MMSSRLVLFSCVALFALSTASTLKGIPDSEERAYLYVNEEAEEFWFALGAIPDGTDISTDATHQELAVVSDGIGACHADAVFQIDAQPLTVIMTFKSTTGLPTGNYVYSCTGSRSIDDYNELALHSDKQTRIPLHHTCTINTAIKITTVKMVRPFNCLIWLVVKGKKLNSRLETYPMLIPPTEIGSYASSHDRHPHEQFDRSPDGKRIINLMEARYSFHEYYKGADRPIPTMEISTDSCKNFEVSFEINDVCKIQIDILPDNGFYVLINFLELDFHRNKWNAEAYIDGDANGTQIVFTTNEVLLYVVRPTLKIYNLGSCDLGPKDVANATFILQAWCDKSREYVNCTVPAIKFPDEVYVKRPPKRPALTDFNWEKQKPIKRKKRPIYFVDYLTKREVEYVFIVALVVIGANITINILIVAHRRIDEHYRNLPVGYWD